MRDGGTLTIQTEVVARDGDSFVRTRIGDTGKGIPAGELERIFVPFYTTKTQGTGLGLPICRKLVTQNGGTISVESRVNEGTTFIIDLPVVAGQTTNRKEESRAQA
jgi:hypothetical protein